MCALLMFVRYFHVIFVEGIFEGVNNETDKRERERKTSRRVSVGKALA